MTYDLHRGRRGPTRAYEQFPLSCALSATSSHIGQSVIKGGDGETADEEKEV